MVKSTDAAINARLPPNGILSILKIPRIPDTRAPIPATNNTGLPTVTHFDVNFSIFNNTGEDKPLQRGYKTRRVSCCCVSSHIDRIGFG